MTIAADMLDRAQRAHVAGDLSEAWSLYENALALELPAPVNAQAMCRLGVLELQQGQPARALETFRKAIALCPQEDRFYFGLGRALAELGRFQEAIAAYHKVLATVTDSADVHFAMGIAEQSLGNLQSARAAYMACLNLKPEFPEALNNLGNCHGRCNDDDAAENAYRRALAIRENFADAHSNLGILLARRGRNDEALAALGRAVALEPLVTNYRVNLGAALLRQKAVSEAVVVLREAVRLDPRHAEAHYNLGNAILGLGDHQQAAASYRRAVGLDPRHLDACLNLSVACTALGQAAEAKEACAAALAIDPGSVAALSNAGCVHRMLGELDTAAELLRKAQSLAPDSSAVANNLGDVLKDAGDLDGAIACFREAVRLDPSNSLAHSNLAYSLHFQALDGASILEECLRWDARHSAPPRISIELVPRTHVRTPERRLRIGYVSGDFRNHCQSLFTIPLFSNHDRRSVEIFCYSNGREDDFTARIKSIVDHWRDIRPLEDEEVCHKIAADHVDVLVDLGMHMAYGRPGVFSRRAAPIQAAWLAYPGTTGLRAIDYLIADPHLIPPHLEGLYRERIHRLPQTFWCYDPLSDGPQVNVLPALRNGYVTFGSLNAPCKISERAIAMWAEILNRVGESRLMLMAPAGFGRQRLLGQFECHRVPAARIEFVPFQPRRQYLEAYHHIDIALDPFPYNGHTTSLDAWWMGVPVPSRFGQTAVSRGGLSQLTNLGFAQWGCASDEQYVETVVGMARKLADLADLRHALRPHMERSPLMDKVAFARAMESAFASMSGPPDHSECQGV